MTVEALQPTAGAALRVQTLIGWAETGGVEGLSLDAIRVALYADVPASLVRAGLHTVGCGYDQIEFSTACTCDGERRMSVIHSAALTLPCTCRHDHDGVIGLPCARCQIVTEAEGEKP